MKVIEKVAWIHIEDRRVLMLRSRGKDAFYFPGGKPEGNESIAQAITRELREELGITFRPASTVLIGPPFRAPAHGRDGVTLECRCVTGEHSGTFVPQSEIEELRFFSYDERHELTPMGRLVFEFLGREGYI